ncbi:toxin glutamine deamidase domain-containing protein [Mycobacterium talmoniae]|uniref:Uncharacterized protein n=1 Tax=Mycobacterium talmoniae TaxID=1858794 RepID=A0A1S1NLC2_9MYCO|nr:MULTISPECIES: toxin glutamine deamidase domain-containing protein [Mycobacterium]OHV04664.1 hypothetical protein BKN37_08825 [Mycobacterium talmoniae]TDH49304.1 hypothetical protein E2F47_21085 [Mycobacterium eburneum]
MTIGLPGGLSTALGLVGEHLPTGDEDACRRQAAQWREYANQLEAYKSTVDNATRATLLGFRSGHFHTELHNQLNTLPNEIDTVVQQLRQLADSVEDVATQIESVKDVFVAQLRMLALTIAAYFWAPGGGLIIATRAAAAKLIIRGAIQRAITLLAQHAAQREITRQAGTATTRPVATPRWDGPAPPNTSAHHNGAPATSGRAPQVPAAPKGLRTDAGQTPQPRVAAADSTRTTPNSPATAPTGGRASAPTTDPSVGADKATPTTPGADDTPHAAEPHQTPSASDERQTAQPPTAAPPKAPAGDTSAQPGVTAGEPKTSAHHSEDANAASPVRGERQPEQPAPGEQRPSALADTHGQRTITDGDRPMATASTDRHGEPPAIAESQTSRATPGEQPQTGPAASQFHIGDPLPGHTPASTSVPAQDDPPPAARPQDGSPPARTSDMSPTPARPSDGPAAPTKPAEDHPMAPKTPDNQTPPKGPTPPETRQPSARLTSDAETRSAKQTPVSAATQHEAARAEQPDAEPPAGPAIPPVVIVPVMPGIGSGPAGGEHTRAAGLTAKTRIADPAPDAHERDPAAPTGRDQTNDVPPSGPDGDGPFSEAWSFENPANRRRYGPHQLAHLETLAYQRALEEALSRPAGGYQVGADPRTNPYGALINGGGPAIPGRDNNSNDTALCGLASFYGQPTVAVPRHLDQLPDGSIDSDGEAHGVARARDWLGELHHYDGLPIPEQFAALHQQIGDLGPGAAAYVLTDWHARDPITGAVLFDADGLPVLDGAHASCVVYPFDAAGPVWWDPHDGSTLDHPPAWMVDESAALQFIPTTADHFAPQQGADHAGAGHTGTSAGLPGADQPEPPLSGDPVRDGLGLFTDPGRGAEHAEQAGGVGETGDRLDDRGRDAVSELAGEQGRTDLHGGEAPRDASGRPTDLSPAVEDHDPADAGGFRDHRLRDDGGVADESGGTQPGTSVDDQQADLSTRAEGSAVQRGDVTSGVEQPAEPGDLA